MTKVLTLSPTLFEFSFNSFNLSLSAYRIFQQFLVCKIEDLV